MNYRQPLQSGTVLKGRYRLKHLIGEGGFSLVYSAQNNTEICVIKELFDAERCERTQKSPTLIPRTGHGQVHIHQVRRAREEWARFSNLKHNHIVELIDGFEENNTFYLVMPFVEGESLQTCIERGKVFSAQETVRMLWPIADALDFLHKHSVIHRDVKPDNVWLRKSDGAAILLDTGAARSAEESKRQFTGIFTSFGSPEVRGRSESRIYGTVGPATDVFALAGVCAYAIGGQEPPDLNLRMLHSKNDPILTWSLPTSSAVTQVLRDSLKLHAAERPASTLLFMQMFNDACESRLPPPPQKTNTQQKGTSQNLGKSHVATDARKMNQYLSETSSGKDEVLKSSQKPRAREPLPHPKTSSTLTWIIAIGLNIIPILVLTLLFPTDYILVVLFFLVAQATTITFLTLQKESKSNSFNPIQLIPMYNIFNHFKTSRNKL